MSEIHFEWDEQKDIENFQRHKVKFTDAIRVFRDTRILTMFDEDNSDMEDRWISLGLSQNFPLIVVHTYRQNHENETIRIISARRANKKEIEQYNKPV